MRQDLINQAVAVIRTNDRGAYTVPTQGLYPFQWNWDSALVSLGMSHFDENRALTEIETLLAHQWEDGMVPHIIFHQHDYGYFPGPEVWNTGRKVPTSGITQPAVAGFALKRLMDRSSRPDALKARAVVSLRKIHAWHEWFFRTRDPEGTGLVAIIHPWESGRDNSVDWDDAFTRVPTDGVAPFKRRDTSHANPAHRPTDEQYKRYIYLVQLFRSLGWDNAKLHDASPFRVVDPGFNAILLRSCSDLAALARDLGEAAIAEQSQAFANRGIAAMETLWDKELGQYFCYDRVANRLIESPSVGGLLAAFCAVPPTRAKAIAARIADIANHCRFLVPSHDPRSPDFDGTRYWRGPVWLVVNYMIADGLFAAGETTIAARIEADSIRLIEESGFAEYYDPITAEPCGGGSFTWTAAMVIEMLSSGKIAA
ncbi:MGH1-like glycoside hydrolase domain-containing protein [Thioclava sp. FR2]|uniref:MGH1-like glycoside hydrolase domain-containing protein n=1 Tax=Thioclava sp. FR2 TaxID=3445780 RepID=UPI003EBDF925